MTFEIMEHNNEVHWNETNDSTTRPFFFNKVNLNFFSRYFLSSQQKKKKKKIC